MPLHVFLSVLSPIRHVTAVPVGGGQWHKGMTQMDAPEAIAERTQTKRPNAMSVVGSLILIIPPVFYGLKTLACGYCSFYAYQLKDKIAGAEQIP